MLALFLTAGGVSGQAAENAPSCAFCLEAVLENQKFYEDDLVYALYTHRPIFEGHCLIIPKSHKERFEDLSEEEILQMARVINKVNSAVQKVFHTSSYLLLQKNGQEVGQTVPHVHIHYIPRSEGEGSVVKFFAAMILSNLGSPISKEQMKEKVTLLHEAMVLDER